MREGDDGRMVGRESGAAAGEIGFDLGRFDSEVTESDSGDRYAEKVGGLDNGGNLVVGNFAEFDGVNEGFGETAGVTEGVGENAGSVGGQKGVKSLGAGGKLG